MHSSLRAPTRFLPGLALLTALLVTIVPAQAGDWPRWRGANFDGISAENDWLKQWPADGPKALWKGNVGIGYASMSVAGDRVYTMGNTEEVDSVICLDAATGKEIWRHSYPCSSKDPNGFPGPRVTPTVDQGRVFTLSRNGHFFCLDARTGKPIWAKDFARDFDAKVPQWGFSGSPLVEGQVVITEVGGSGQAVIAFNKADGTEVWRAGDDAAAYSSIVPFDHQGQRTLAVLSAAGIVGRKAGDGAELWRYPWKTSYDVNAATPIVVDGKVFISSGYNKGCALVDFASGTATKVWENKKMRNHVATCVLWKGHLFGFDESELRCLELATGTEKWATKDYGKGSILMAGDKFIVYSDQGRVAVLEPSVEKHQELAGYQALGGKNTWAAPVLANGRLYCRSMQDLVCLDVRAK